jgi:hypothetical protein
MVAPNPLSEQDLAAARTELEAGKPFTVWFTPAAVGVPAGGSAKVISIDDAIEGDFIQVRPARTRDTMFCSPSELTRTRPARTRARPPAKQRAPKRVAPSQSKRRPPAPPRESEPRPAAPESSPDRPRPRGGPTVSRPAEVTVTLSATADGEWTVEVVIGQERAVRPTSVPPAEVAKAARSLPPAVAEAIKVSLEGARARQIERVERLRTELDAAQRALQELSGPA